MEIDPPRFEHDCDRCVFLGRHGDVDLYYCPQHGFPTVIAREGSGGNYRSGLIGADHDPDLKEARQRAWEHGLLKRPE